MRVSLLLRQIAKDIGLTVEEILGRRSALIKALTLDTDPRSNIKADHNVHTTNLPGVFAAGDCRRGQSLVVWAINEGRAAARECDRHLMGTTTLP